MLSRVRRDKRAISVVIGYVLLIAISIVMSVLVYQWLRTYVPKEAIKCEEGTSVFLKDVSYDCAASKLTLTIKNNGKFDVDGFFIHISNKRGEDLAAIDISKNIDNSKIGYLAGNEIKFSEIAENSLSPESSSNTGIFSFDTASYGTLYKVEIIPVRIEEIDNKKRLVSCSDAKVSEDLTCAGSSGGTPQVIRASCKEILSSGNSHGDGTYTIDPDGDGSIQPFEVYCDMTTDGGGWTLVQTTVKGQAANSQWASPFSSQLETTIGTASINQPYRLAMKYWYMIPHTEWAKIAVTTAEGKKTFDKSSLILTGVDSTTSPTKFTYTGSDNSLVLNVLTNNPESAWNTCTDGLAYFNAGCCGTCILFSAAYYNANNQPMMSTVTAVDGTSLQKWNGYVPLDRLNIFLK